ncbi:alpha/beta fold hydrolase [Gloeothece verrucosa]|uniref:Alpha/beta hydrolase fold protein n=1 Tax=Gloeothece verrucosa (strain PCC 7822) TaxID=497965 RepID=E0UL72_GLOV7|nr:alpha/beta fold hydrolase [Gloeothece verrucosa]ADN17702.1 alpha/beta hydrolase fold protein [Gloeothece verrucosa PCC 7822]
MRDKASVFTHNYFQQCYYKNNLGQLSYLDSYQQKKETIIFLHGFTNNSHSFLGLPETIINQYRCLIPDLPGHGKTHLLQGANTFNTDAQVALLKEWLCSLKVNKFHLLGYSMGGRLALQFALKNLAQIQSLILVSTTAGIQDEIFRLERRQADDKLATKILSSEPIDFLKFWLSQPLFQGISEQGEDFIAEEIKKRLPLQKSGLVCSLKYFSSGIMPSVWDQLAKLKMPCLIIAGSRDTKYSKIAWELVNSIPNTKINLLQTTHTPLIESPLLFWKSVIKFLQEEFE